LKNDLRYSPTDALEPFPFPSDSFRDELNQLGERLHVTRQTIMRTGRIGLTKLYNRIKNPKDNDPCIAELRELHREIDHTVANSYGWHDIDLDHGFHEVSYLPENDRVRFTISESARIELIQRLSELNRRRSDEEVEKSLHPAKPGGKR
jgi:hypothetical protein